MNWKTKALIQRLISKTPFAHSLNYLLQTKVTRNLPMSNEVLEQKKDAVEKHLKAFTSHEPDIAADAIAYEFGGGYDLAIPLGLAKGGIKHQVITDRKPLLKTTLVKDAANRLGVTPAINNISDAKALGIEYKIEKDASATGFETGSFDFIYSTDTLEHIPEKDILPVLQECYRLLKAGGIISCIIDLQDHYQYTDKSISPFNFYQYSREEWDAQYNNQLQYQNRLLANQYYTQFALAGFAPIQLQLTEAAAAETEQLKKLQLHADFAGKPLEELNSLRCHIWAEKPD